MVTKQTPKVTVGLLVHNAEATLRKTIESVLSQTFADFEVILADDASVDESPRICEQFVNRDGRFRLLRHEINLGGIVNFNRVVAEAQGEYFVWLSDHDLWLPDYLASCVEALDTSPSAVLCHTAVRLIDEDSAPLGVLESRLDTRGLSQRARLSVTMWSLQRGTACIYGLQRLQAIRRLKRFPMLYRHILAPDVVLLLEIALLGEIVYIDRPLFALRHPTDSQDAAIYMAKLHLIPKSELDGLVMFCRILAAEVQAVWSQVSGLHRRAMAVMSVLAFMATDYRGLLKTAMVVGHRQRLKTKTGDSRERPSLGTGPKEG